MRHLKKENIICLTPHELKDLYRSDGKEKLRKILRKKNYSWKELINDYDKKKEVSDSAAKKNLKCKEQVEILIALNSCIVFYGENSEIGFPLKDSYNLKKNPIQNLEDLKNATEQKSLIDFSIICNNLIYNYQFKQYKGGLKTEKFLEFMKEKLETYGNKITNVNLLIMLQGPESVGMQTLKIDFKRIRKELNSRYRSLGGSILVRFNEGNKFNYIIEIYPGNSGIKYPIDPDYLAGKLLYS